MGQFWYSSGIALLKCPATYSCNRIERLIWLNYKKTLGTIVIKCKLYIYSSFGVKAEEERNRAYEEKNESSLVSGSVTISRAGSVPGYGSTGMGTGKQQLGLL